MVQVNEEFQAVHERLTEESQVTPQPPSTTLSNSPEAHSLSQLREASEERVVESLEGVSAYFTKGVDLIR